MITPISILIPFYKKDGEFYLWTQVRDSKDELTGMLEFPGGKIESHESPLQAVKREVSEETGVDVEHVDLFGAFSFGSGLLLHTYLFEDRAHTFCSEGYKRISDLRAGEFQVPPNNIVIVEKLSLYFQRLKE